MEVFDSSKISPTPVDVSRMYPPAPVDKETEEADDPSASGTEEKTNEKDSHTVCVSLDCVFFSLFAAVLNVCRKSFPRFFRFSDRVFRR